MECRRVEDAVDRLKNYRTVAARYGRRCYVFPGTVTAVSLPIWLGHDRSASSAYRSARRLSQNFSSSDRGGSGTGPVSL